MAQFLCLQTIIELLSSAFRSRVSSTVLLCRSQNISFLSFRSEARNFYARLGEEKKHNEKKGEETFLIKYSMLFSLKFDVADCSDSSRHPHAIK